MRIKSVRLMEYDQSGSFISELTVSLGRGHVQCRHAVSLMEACRFDMRMYQEFCNNSQLPPELLKSWKGEMRRELVRKMGEYLRGILESSLDDLEKREDRPATIG